VRVVWSVLLKDLRLRARSPLAPLVYLAFPFVFAGLIALAFGGGGGRAPRIPIALVDEDGGLLGPLVRGAMGQEQAAQFLEVRETTLAEAEELIARNRIAGAIILPEGFSSAVLDRRPTEVRVLRNPASSLGPLAAEETAAFLALLLESAARLLGEPIDRLRAFAAPDEGGAWSPAWAVDGEVAEVAVLVNRRLQSVARFAFPPAIRLIEAPAPLPPPPAAEAATGDGGTSRASEEPKAASATRFSVIYRAVLPGLAAFALFLLAIGLGADIFREQAGGTLARMLAAPTRAGEIIAGKLLATLAIGMIVSAAMALLGALLGVRADPAAFALLSLAFLAAVTGFVHLLYSLAKDERQGGTISSIALMAMAFLGGSFIPLEAMPAFARQLAPLTLNYWAIRGYRALILGEPGVASVALPLLVLVPVAIVTLPAGGWLLRRRFARGV